MLIKSVESIYKGCPIFSAGFAKSGARGNDFFESIQLGNATQGIREDKENETRNRKPICRYTMVLRWLLQVGLIGEYVGMSYDIP